MTRLLLNIDPAVCLAGNFACREKYRNPISHMSEAGAWSIPLAEDML